MVDGLTEALAVVQLSCGGGVKENFRVCNNPTPFCQGKKCNGTNLETEECNEHPCN